MVVAAHRDAEQDPVEAGAPGVLRELVHRERRPRLLVETPADARARDPAADPLELVVGEAEPAPARLGGGEVEHLRGGHPAAAQLEEHPGHREQRVRADQRPVGELDPQPVRRVPGDPDPVSGLRTGGREPEPGGDQRRVRLDVRAHHQDVAGLEGRVVLEQADQHLAQHVDLARGPVARVHLEAAVGRVVVAAGPLLDRRGVVGAQVGLEQTQQRRPVVGGWRHRVAVREARSVEGAAQLARVAPERRQQRVADQLGRLVVLAGDGSARAAHAAERVPQRRRGLREVEVHVAALAERPQQLDLGGRQPRVPEQRQPRRQVEAGSPVAQGRDRRRVPDVRRRRVHATQQPPPQLGLPRQVGVEGPAGAVGVPALAPVGDERRSLGGVRREQRRQPDRHAVAAVAAQLGVVTGVTVPEVRGQGRAPGLAEAGVDGGQQGPDQPVGVPGVVGLAADEQRHQRPGLEEPDAGADPVATRLRRRAGATAAGSATARRHGRERPRPPGRGGRRGASRGGRRAPPPTGRCAVPGAGEAPRGDPRRCR